MKPHFPTLPLSPLPIVSGPLPISTFSQVEKRFLLFSADKSWHTNMRKKYNVTEVASNKNFIIYIQNMQYLKICKICRKCKKAEYEEYLEYADYTNYAKYGKYAVKAKYAEYADWLREGFPEKVAVLLDFCQMRGGWALPKFLSTFVYFWSIKGVYFPLNANDLNLGGGRAYLDKIQKNSYIFSGNLT